MTVQVPDKINRTKGKHQVSAGDLWGERGIGHHCPCSKCTWQLRSLVLHLSQEEVPGPLCEQFGEASSEGGAKEEDPEEASVSKKCLLTVENTAPTASQNKVEESLVWGKTFDSSLPSEDWVQCLFCQPWSHEPCTEGAEHYICHNYDSD